RHSPAVVCLEEIVEQLHAAAMELPGLLLTRVEAEGQSRAEREGWILAEIVVARRVPISTVPFCTASSTCRPGTISPAANTWIWNLPLVADAQRLEINSAPPKIVSRLFGQLAAMRHLTSGWVP